MRQFKSGRKPLAHPEKFFSNVDITADGCWNWRGGKNKKGYGGVCVDNRSRTTHRHSWILTHGEIPDGMLVCHRCDNPSCINPAHLFLGTNSDNMQDMVRKRRSDRSGERNNACKLTDPQVLEIRKRYRYGLGGRLAKEYRVSLSTIMNVVSGRSGRYARTVHLEQEAA